MSLDPERRAKLRDRFFANLGSPTGPFRLSALAWGVRGRR
jgi:hypothetical protein